jgi:hypothetical protein
MTMPGLAVPAAGAISRGQRQLMTSLSVSERPPPGTGGYPGQSRGMTKWSLSAHDRANSRSGVGIAIGAPRLVIVTDGRGRWAGAGYGILAILTLSVGLYLGVRVVPRVSAGTFDPLSGAMSFVSLAAFFWSSLLAARVACRQYVDVTAQAAGLAVQVGTVSRPPGCTCWAVMRRRSTWPSKIRYDQADGTASPPGDGRLSEVVTIRTRREPP